MDRRIETAVGIMRERRHRNLRVRELAQRVNLSTWHFIRLFKAETSFSPKQYLRDLRMKKAQELLNQSFLSVKEIAASLGFEDHSQFSRDFKRYCGCAPSEFRARSGSQLPASNFRHKKAT
jgi:transcriptional regulator GlxA family with amidase domain